MRTVRPSGNAYFDVGLEESTRTGGSQRKYEHWYQRMGIDIGDGDLVSHEMEVKSMNPTPHPYMNGGEPSEFMDYAAHSRADY